MARIRTIKPEFWDDLKLSKISRDARLLYIGMWNFSDDLGVIIGDSVWIKSKVFPFDHIQIQQFDKWIQELVKSGFISLFSHIGEKFYYLPNLTRHQIINRPNLAKVNVKQSDLQRIKNSLIDHGTISDESYSGKEEERKGEEKETLPDGSAKKENDSLEIPLTDFEKFNARLKKDCPNVCKLEKQITEAEFEKLMDKYSKNQIWDIMERMENKKDLVRRYTGAYRTALNWLKNEQ